MGVCKRSFTKINYTFYCICNESSAVDQWSFDLFADKLKLLFPSINHIILSNNLDIILPELYSILWTYRTYWMLKLSKCFRKGQQINAIIRFISFSFFRDLKISSESLQNFEWRSCSGTDHQGGTRSFKAVEPLLSPTCHDLSLPIFLYPVSFKVYQATPPWNG